MNLEAIAGLVLSGKVGAILASIAIGYGLSKMPDLLGRLAGRALDKALAVGDQADDELLFAVVKWAEAKLPVPGMGSDKYKLVAHRAALFFPHLKLDEAKLAERIEQAVAKMKAEADSRLPKIP